ncbi:hypothetical protein, partial [Flavobacterium sp.]|uniref:hypothetical protein n=1 Tax=Flavobacterium sp. TaxID=239 RepID=UPI0025BB5846
MDKQTKISKKQSGRPSKILMSFALVIAFSLPYLLVSHFSPHNKNESVNTISSLHQLADIPVISIEKHAKSTVLPSMITALPEPILVKPLAKQTTKPLEKKLHFEDTPIKSELTPIKIVHQAVKKAVQNNVWQTVTPRSGDSMAAIFKRLGLSAQNLHAILHRNPHSKILTSIKPSQKLQFLINKNTLEKLVIPMNDIQTLVIYKEKSAYKTRIDSKKTTNRSEYIVGTVKGSLFSTAQKSNIPSKLIQQMTQILNKEIDFSHSVRTGDTFAIAYNSVYVENKKV